MKKTHALISKRLRFVPFYLNFIKTYIIFKIVEELNFTLMLEYNKGIKLRQSIHLHQTNIWN